MKFCEKCGKEIITVLILLCMLCCLIGCECKHNYDEATCTTPEICNKCGAIGGGALGHNYNEATCTTPEVCNKCGTIDGEALGHNYENGKCTNCSAYIPIEDIGFTNTFGYNTWIEIRSYQTDSTGENLESVELFAKSYGRYGLSLCVSGFRLNETYLEDILIETKNPSTVYTKEERAIINKSNQQITLNECVSEGLAGYPTVTVFERHTFKGKIIVRLDSEDNIGGYYIPLEMIDFETLKEVKRIDEYRITYKADIK